MNKKPKICIIGFGRFGRLLARILMPYADIFVISSREIADENIQQIKYEDLGIIDITIPSVPISKLQETLKTINPFLKKGSLVMDVCSVKVYPCQWMMNILRDDVEILGSHPMFGPDSAKTTTNGLQVVICPLRISDLTLDNVCDIFRQLQLKIINTSPEDHDRQAAKSLSLVHFIGRALTGINIKKQEISTLGFGRLLAVNETVENDTWELFFDMHRYNPFSKEIRNQFIESLQTLNSKLREDEDGL